jgi:hypothetical protein
MSTPVSFDLAGLRRAIESGDAVYRTALYADDAELRIVNSDAPACPPHVLQGRSAIAGWIASVYASDGTHRVLESATEGEQIRLVEEQQTADGERVVYVIAAEVDRGQIVRETAVLSQHRYPSDRRPAVMGVGPDGTALMIDQSPGSTPDPPTHAPSPGTAVARHVPGYYLG